MTLKGATLVHVDRHRHYHVERHRHYRVERHRHYVEGLNYGQGTGGACGRQEMTPAGRSAPPEAVP
jgi:hypothetical protein